MQQLTQLLADLVKIPSINPAYEQGLPETGVAEYLRQYFRGLNVELSDQPVFPDRSNLVIKLAGKNRDRRIILEAHMDTASITGMSISPFDPVIESGRLYGRGSCDTKAGLACMAFAVAELARQSIAPPCDVWLAATVDEEYSYRGVLKLCEGLSAEVAIVAEPTDLRLVVASKGVIRWRIHTHGKAAHSSKPHLGTNAISHMARLIHALEEDSERLAEHQHRLVGSATLNVGTIRGGVQVNFVPDHCTIEVDRRMLPGETVEAVLAHYQGLIDQLAEQHPGFAATMDAPILTDVPLETPESCLPIQVASNVLKGLGLNPEPCGVPFGSDASKLARIGIPSCVFGPGSIDQAHAAVEYVDLEQVERAFAFYHSFLLAFE